MEIFSAIIQFSPVSVGRESSHTQAKHEALSAAHAAYTHLVYPMRREGIPNGDKVAPRPGGQARAGGLRR